MPPLPGGVNNGDFSANGIFGRFIFVDPTEQVVVAIQSAWRPRYDRAAEAENVAMTGAAVRALRTEPASQAHRRGERSGPRRMQERVGAQSPTEVRGFLSGRSFRFDSGSVQSNAQFGLLGMILVVTAEFLSCLTVPSL